MVFQRFHFRNGTLIRSSSETNLYIGGKFIQNITFMEQIYNQSQLELFKTPDRQRNCFRFNGNTTDKLVNVTSTRDLLNITMVDQYIETISRDEYFLFKYFLSDDLFRVFVSENFLNSFLENRPLYLPFHKSHEIKIVKLDVEFKLGEPHSNCKNSLKELPYHHMNCIESCTFREIKNNYNCTFDSFFMLNDLKECQVKNKTTAELFAQYLKEFENRCEKKCPLSCESVKFGTKSSILKDYGEIDNLTNFQISVSDFSSLQITQIPKTTSLAFLSEIGGILGLFMGISALNFIEFFYCFIQIFLTAFIN